MQENELMLHKTERKETPVLAQIPELIHESENLVAFNKPSSMPVHSCGNFHHNTLCGIIENELKFKGLKTVHRLDRQTSGIVFFAKNEEASNSFREAMLSNQVSKVYYARVKGDFRKACEKVVELSEESKQDAEDKFVAKCDQTIFCKSNLEA